VESESESIDQFFNRIDLTGNNKYKGIILPTTNAMGTDLAERFSTALALEYDMSSIVFVDSIESFDNCLEANLFPILTIAEIDLTGYTIPKGILIINLTEGEIRMDGIGNTKVTQVLIQGLSLGEEGNTDINEFVWETSNLLLSAIHMFDKILVVAKNNEEVSLNQAESVARFIVSTIDSQISGKVLYRDDDTDIDPDAKIIVDNISLAGMSDDAVDRLIDDQRNIIVRL